MTASPHPFDAAVALESGPDGRLHGTTHPLWANMVGPYGGIVAATLLQAAVRDPARLGEPVALTVNYAAPVADGPFVVDARAVRTNRSTQHWTMTLAQDDGVAATATAVFALRRDTWAAAERTMPDAPPADGVPPHGPRASVVWSARYDMRFVAGEWPDLRADVELPDSGTALWIRDEPPRPLDAPSLAAICDAFYPRVFRRRQRFTPAGTVSLTVQFHADAAELAAQGTRPVFALARGLRFSKGFHDQRAEVWGDDGRLLATSSQLVYYRD
ncbi:MAG: hypothetical protein RJA99_2025 [Pseudomonadota bacterium]|jgi:acyl-coenzyme A thioesterase PaaI-like protein